MVQTARLKVGHELFLSCPWVVSQGRISESDYFKSIISVASLIQTVPCHFEDWHAAYQHVGG